jgi:predicted acetyltransferase
MRIENWPTEEDRHYAVPSEIGLLADADLVLRLNAITEARPEDRWAADLVFGMYEGDSADQAGEIRLRLADTPQLVYSGGHIGFGVEKEFQGRRFAARAVRLVLPVAAKAGMDTVWITTDPTNIASKRSIEIAGGVFIDERERPVDHKMYEVGYRRVLRYRFDLSSVL